MWTHKNWSSWDTVKTMALAAQEFRREKITTEPSPESILLIMPVEYEDRMKLPGEQNWSRSQLIKARGQIKQSS